MFVIIRTDGCYVARSGLKSSYTHSLQDARVYRTREAAEADLCPENEQITTVEEAMHDVR